MKVKKPPIFGLVCIALLMLMIIDTPLRVPHGTSRETTQSNLPSETMVPSDDAARNVGGESVPKMQNFESGNSNNETAAGVPFDEYGESDGWIVEGTGTSFAITNSEYLNITLTSSEPVHVCLKSVPRMVIFSIERTNAAYSTRIKIAGFEPNSIYYRYQDGNIMENFTANSMGEYTYAQDISQDHHIYTFKKNNQLLL